MRLKIPRRLSGYSPRFLVWLVLALVLVTGAAVAVQRETVHNGATTSARPDFQRILDDLVTGPGRVAAGATAFVSGPHGTWVGSAGFANIDTGEAMQPNARMHLDSNSKAWTATLILQLVGEGEMKLDDTVERWLPGLLPYGRRITVRQLLNHTSGLIDLNDMTADPMNYIRRVRDSALRAELLRLYRREVANPTLAAPTMLWVRFAAALPLLSAPGTTYHYSNIGYDIAGLIAAKVSGTPLANLYRQRIIAPLGLASAVYKPQGEVSGPHPRDYSVNADGTLVDATDWYRVGSGADTGIISDASDEAHFLTALMQGELLRPAQLTAMETPPMIGSIYGLGLQADPIPCFGLTFHHGGASYSTTSAIYVSPDGKRVAVILLNGNTNGTGTSTLDPRGGNAVVAAANQLFCGA